MRVSLCGFGDDDDDDENDDTTLYRKKNISDSTPLSLK